MHPHIPYDTNGAETVTLSADEAALAHSLLAKLLASPHPAVIREADQTTADAIERDIQALARSIYQSRKRRAEHFAASIFSEPAWDMLLVLFIYGDRGDRMSVTRLAEFSESPLTTAIRWLDYLESQRMIARSQCATDKRKFFVSLSDKGRRMMSDYFRSLIEGGTTIPRA